MRRIATMAAGLALAGWLAGAPAAAEGLQGSARIVEVHALAGTVVLDDQEFRVDDSTRIEDEQGGELALAALPSEAAGAHAEETAVWFVAGEPDAAGVRRLLELRLTGAMPK